MISRSTSAPCCSSAPEKSKRNERPLALKLATYNVNGVNGRLPRLLEWLEETSPDIVCLQELKTTDEKCPARVLEDAGYGSLWHGHVVRALERARPCLAGLGKAGGAGGRSQRGPHQGRHLRRMALAPRRSDAARKSTTRRSAATAGFRMDFLMLTPGLLPRLRASGVDSEQRGREKPSDHAPVWVQL